MGFFSSVLGGGKSTSSSSSGFNTMPEPAKKALMDIIGGTSAFISPWDANNGANQANIDRFTPMGQTADETTAFNAIRQGFTPNQQTLNADISMLQNPFNESVISEINRQGNGQNSILRQTMDNAGQFGSNRSILGANDIDLSRMNTIGGFLQGQFNQNLNHALTTLPALRAMDTQGLLDIGSFQRNLDMQTKQAPVTAIQTAAGISNGMGATVNNQTQTQSSGGGGGFADLLGKAGGIASGISSLGTLFSDVRLKHNIEHVGKENGHNVYSFSYKGDDKKYVGVMAQEVIQKHPEAVSEVAGYYKVNYDMIGVNFREQ
jgi:hypothetical protein